MKKALFVVATVSAAPALTFDRPASTKVSRPCIPVRAQSKAVQGSRYSNQTTFQKDVAFMPFQQEVNRPNGKDIIKDYTSEDGNTKYHAEFHYNTGTHVKM